MDVDEGLVAARGVIPSAHARADVPKMMMECAHLHDRRFVEPPADLEGELRLVVPGVVAPRDRIAAVQRIEVDHVEPGSVVELGGLRGYLRQQSRVTVRTEAAKALAEVMHLRARLVRSDGGAAVAQTHNSTLDLSRWCAVSCRLFNNGKLPVLFAWVAVKTSHCISPCNR